MRNEAKHNETKRLNGIKGISRLYGYIQHSLMKFC